MHHRHQDRATRFSSNEVRLSSREWLGLMLVFMVLAALARPIWNGIEVFQPSPDYRIPYDSSEDYWPFERACREAADSNKTFVVGDSFIWGQYVSREETLSHYLNQGTGSEQFVNAGLDGAHPLALEGLLKHYCKALQDTEVILHLNLLWLSSSQADLQVGRGGRLNHPNLLPQIRPTIPGYEASVSERLGILAARHLPVLEWSRHVQSRYFDNADLQRWTLDHPYLNPLHQITPTLPPLESPLRGGAQPWSAEGRTQQRLPWVEIDTSLQWRGFQRLVATLQERGNRVFVLVGPLNEHMLESTSRAVYRGILGRVEYWLEDEGLAHFLPPVLPSELYADMSHPLAGGYALLAQDLLERMPS